MIKNHQSFYHSDSLISYLLIPTLMDVGKDQILFESGSTIPNTTTTGSAFVGHKTLNEQWLLLAALGEQNDLIGGARARFNSDNAQSFLLMQNPVHLFLNFKFWGQNLVLGTSYSKYENKLGLDQEKSNTVALGYRFGLLHFDFHFAALDRSVLANGDELFTEQPLQFVGLYELDSAELAIKYDSYFQKNTSGGLETKSEDQQIVQISYYDDTKIQDIQFNYRLEYQSRSIKDKSTNLVNRVNSFPVTLGFKNQVTSWLNVLGSVRQHLFVNQGLGPLTTNNTTSVNIGAQLTYSDIRIDALLSGLSTAAIGNQNLDGGNLLSQVSLVYKY